MRYSELILESIPSSPEFKKWFEGSKVVDKDGRPLRVFHGTSESFTLPFKEFTYFGTAEAANSRVRSAPSYKHNGRVYPVFLHIQNPFVFTDKGNYRNTDILLAMGDQGLISRNNLPEMGVEPEYDDEADELRYMIEEENKIIQILSSRGYDGATFKNTVEDKNSISWICFSNTQIWPEFR